MMLKSIMQRSVLTKGKLGESSVTSLPYQVEVIMKLILGRSKSRFRLVVSFSAPPLQTDQHRANRRAAGKKFRSDFGQQNWKQTR
jgi:hypothetical protein